MKIQDGWKLFPNYVFVLFLCSSACGVLDYHRNTDSTDTDTDSNSEGLNSAFIFDAMVYTMEIFKLPSLLHVFEMNS